jgi:quercetin dioxygenase-like cupin family protein
MGCEFITLLSGAAAMEKAMRYFTILLVVALLGGTDRLAAQETVETRGITSEVKIDEVIFGHLTELNGRFKLRATELTFAPDGYVGVHHHIGPGIRYVITGELTFAEGGQETVYKAGEYYFETGNLETCRFAYWPWRSFRKIGRPPQ